MGCRQQSSAEILHLGSLIQYPSARTLHAGKPKQKKSHERGEGDKQKEEQENDVETE